MDNITVSEDAFYLTTETITDVLPLLCQSSYQTIKANDRESDTARIYSAVCPRLDCMRSIRNPYWTGGCLRQPQSESVETVSDTTGADKGIRVKNFSRTFC